MKRNYMLMTEPSLVSGVAAKLRYADGVYVRYEGIYGVSVTAPSADAVLDALIPMEGYSLRDVKECV